MGRLGAAPNGSLISGLSFGGDGDSDNENNDSNGGHGGAGNTVTITNSGTLTVESNQVILIGDTLADSRVSQLPIVATAPRFRAYAGHPLSDEQGACVGTLCVFDLKPREFGPDRESREYA